jgi:ubiquinone/menaquinone biosynthesis C-methylase UbiE
VLDVWSAVADLEPSQQERLAEVLETRGADPQQQELRAAFLDGVEIPQEARALEVGCGTGVLARRLAVRPDVRETVGVDVAPSLVERARALSSGVLGLEFLTADARALPFDEGDFDLVVFDSTLCHVPDAERAVEESFRVLRPGGVLAAFDGDYSTVTVALGEHDPCRPASRRWWIAPCTTGG